MRGVMVFHQDRVYLPKELIAEEFSISTGTVRNRLKEIEENPRYGQLAVIRDGSNILLINKYAFADWMKYGKQLQEKNAKKYVPEYNPAEWAKAFGNYQELIEEAK